MAAEHSRTASRFDDARSQSQGFRATLPCGGDAGAACKERKTFPGKHHLRLPNPSTGAVSGGALGAVPYFAIATALLGLGLAVYFRQIVLAADPGNEKMQSIAANIRDGAMAFLKREYTWVAVFVLVMFVVMSIFIDTHIYGGVAYLMGAASSALAGYVGMRIATAANVRTTQAAREGSQKALPLAFRGGAVMGFAVAGLGLLGVALCYIIFVKVLEVDDAFAVIAAYGLGGSSIALFARIGGGIYTKAADVGADLVGKVEAGIPEDDPRNPATIADNVGDNVGDVAGMGADLFESYAGSLFAPMTLVALLFANAGGIDVDDTARLVQKATEPYFLFPLLIGAIGMVASVIGALMVRGGTGSLSAQLHRGQYVAMGLTTVGTLIGAFMLFSGDDVGEVKPLFIGGSVILGMVAGWAIGFTSEYFTSDHYPPVKDIAANAETGPATVVISGIAKGNLSTAPAVLLVALTIGISYWMGEQFAPDLAEVMDIGLYGVALAAIGMLATTGVVVAVDAYGPIADNAGGIAEMAELPPEVREVTDALDSLGNTTAAVAKGFAIGSAAITALALFKAFSFAAGLEGGPDGSLSISDVPVTIGLFIGGVTPFVFAALTMESVGRAAQKMIEEVRRQFREIPGLREGVPGVEGEYAKCVDISTDAALREMLLPGALAVVLPLGIGFVSVQALGGFLAGALVTGFLLAIYMSNSGGAWDNAKKYIEAGHLGGKGSDAHKAAVVGDTIGDPFKDTSGPSMNILIKVMTVVSLVFAPAMI
ncbi:MAG: sodium-translocating pyrophosphatase [Acidimicrobiia bacterium]|nr:sodium-translocating pyrophosphatase [Acidimicrobiia bacterium]MBP8180791.1 sodium-translocating pyrophosphatase [Acidimicrobiia bacterium]